MEVKYNDGDRDMVKDKILLQRSVNPKKVDLPDGQTFYARYERVSRKNLSANVTINKSRTIGLRRGHKPKQQEAGILSRVFKLGTKLFKPSYLKKKNLKLVLDRQTLPSEKKIIKEGIK